ncbi:MAG: helix-turn-helix domain-containing protein [Monoglobaceae bacterium]
MVETTQLFVDAYNYFINIDNIMYDFFNTKMLGEILNLFITAHKANPTLLAEMHLSRNTYTTKLLSYISSHLDKNISIETLTNEFHISKTKLYTMIKNSTGFSFKQLILQLRLTRAFDYLNTGMSVTEIANRLGFNSYSHFIKTFKQKTGYSPNQYRKHLRDYATDEYTNDYNFPINRIYPTINSNSESESK